MSTHTVVIARKPHDADISHFSPNCHPYLKGGGGFNVVIKGKLHANRVHCRGGENYGGGADQSIQIAVGVGTAGILQ